MKTLAVDLINEFGCDVNIKQTIIDIKDLFYMTLAKEIMPAMSNNFSMLFLPLDDDGDTSTSYLPAKAAN